MKWYALALAVLVFISACGTPSINTEESRQQEQGSMAILRNQPVPDLGGYSFEREVVRQTYIARNQGVTTFSYFITEFDGKVVELCASRGCPIPYATQLTAPEKRDYGSGGATPLVLPQSEPNGLYPPVSAEATLVQCVNKDGSVSPLYIEQRVFALPYRIKSDKVLQRYDDSEPSFKIQSSK